MAIERFEVGKYYRWNGGSEVTRSMIEDYREMRPILDGRPRRCVQASIDPAAAAFEGIPGGSWHWYDTRCFDLVCMNNEDAEPYPGYFTHRSTL